MGFVKTEGKKLLHALKYLLRNGMAPQMEVSGIDIQRIYFRKILPCYLGRN
jgi:hypothetical protein